MAPGCYGKRAFKSRSKAMQNKGGANNAYHCMWCNMWHLTKHKQTFKDRL